MEKMRTGLIVESIESADAVDDIERIKPKTERKSACTVTTVEVKTVQQSRILEREIGTYVTVDMDTVCEITDSDFENITDTVATTVRSLISVKPTDRVLIVGIGNRDITADSLGPKCVDRTVVTRGLEKIYPELINDGGFCSVCAINSNVFGVTGIESAELISGIAKELKPALVIVIDALATASISRLCKTVQISNTSLTPGGGVDNTRKEISKSELKTQMLSIGMPTVIDVKTVMHSVGAADSDIKKALGDFENSLVATPVNIHTATDTAAKLIAFSLNKALHYGMSTEEILKFLY